MTDEFDSSVPSSSSESFDSEPEVMPEIPSDLEPELESAPELVDEPEIKSVAEIQIEPESPPELTPELIDEPEIEPAADIQPEPESAPELTPELIDEPEIEPVAEIQPEAESAPELTPELIDEPEIESAADIQPEPDSVSDLMDEPEIEPVAEIQPDLVDDYIGDQISVDDNPVDGEPSAGGEIPVGNEIVSEIQNESQPETESTPEGETDEITEYLVAPDAISEDDILQQVDSSAVNPEMISEQDGLVEEGSPEKQTIVGTEPEANVSSIANTTGSYSQTGVQGSSVDSEDDGITPLSQIDERSQRQPFRTDYSEDDLGKAAVEINNENADINNFVQDLKQQGLTPEQYLEQKRTEYASLDASNSSPLDEHSTPGEQSVNPKTARLFYEGTDSDLVGSSDQEKEREYRIGSPHDDWEDHKNILEGEKQHNIGLAAQTSDKLGEALGTIAEASQGNTDFTEADNYIYGKYGRAPYTDTYPQVAPADATLGNDALQNQSSGVKTIPATDSSARNDAMTDIPVSPPLPDVVYIAQKDSGDATLQSMPPDTNVIKDAQERDITIRRWGDDGLIQLRAYDSATGDVPETPNLGTAGMTNLKIEEEDGQTKVRLQDIVIPPDYRKSGIAGNMLDETVDIAQAKGASEIYGVIENEEALNYWKHMEEKETGWKVDSSQGAHGYVRYDMQNKSVKKK